MCPVLNDNEQQQLTQFEAIPEADRYSKLTQDMFELATKNPLFFQAILERLRNKQNKLDFVMIMRGKVGHGIYVQFLDWVSREPSALKAILDLYSDTQRRGDYTALHHTASSNPSLFEMMLQYYTEDEIKTALTKKTKNNGSTLLTCAAQNHKSLHLILTKCKGQLPEKALDTRTLQCAADHDTESLKLLLPLYTDEKKCLAVLKNTSNFYSKLELMNGLPAEKCFAVLKDKAESIQQNLREGLQDNPEKLKQTLHQLSSAARKTVIKLAIYDKPLSNHRFLELTNYYRGLQEDRQSIPSGSEAFLELLLDKKEQLEVVKSSKWLLPEIADDAELLDYIFSLYPPNERGALAWERGIRSSMIGRIVFGYLRSKPSNFGYWSESNNRKCLELILTEIPEEQRLKALRWRCGCKIADADWLFYKLKPKDLYSMLQLLPPKDRYRFMMSDYLSRDCEHVIDSLIFSEFEPSTVLNILKLFDQAELFKILSYSRRENSILSRSALMPAPESITILQLLKPVDCDYLLTSGSKYSKVSLLHIAAKYQPLTLKSYLDLLTTDDSKRIAIESLDSDGASVLQCAVAGAAKENDVSILKNLKGLYDEKKWNELLLKKDSKGKTAFHYGAENKNVLNFLLSTFPEEDRLSILNKKDAKGHRVVSKSAQASYADILPNDCSTERGCTKIFLSHYKSLLQEQKSNSFGFFRRTKLNQKWPLEKILEHAMKESNRSRKVFVDLKWLTKKGTLNEAAPEIIRTKMEQLNIAPLQKP